MLLFCYYVSKRKCHPMEGVTLTQKEQTRLQVLNNALADQVPVCQAAEILGVSERHIRRILAAYRKALPHSPTGIVAADRPTPRRRPR